MNQQVGDRWTVANVLCSLAEVSVDQRDWTAARSFLEESLAIHLELGDRTAIAFVFECFACIAAAQNKPNLCLRLAGAAQALRAETGSPLSPSEQQRLDQALAPARQELTEERRAELIKVGAALSLDECVAAAKSF